MAIDDSHSQAPFVIAVFDIHGKHHPNHSEIMTANPLRAAILIISQTASKDPSTDAAGPALRDVFASEGGEQWQVVETQIVPDSVLEVQRAVTGWADGAAKDGAINLVVTSGGTGFAVGDVTPEVGGRLSGDFHCFSHGKKTVGWT
ncbi:MAG: hypothetical protein M1819_001454 [Sarea resinae]|nr:MAG: hypothetical protein M1819_001454 [Sarea resinae]